VFNVLDVHYMEIHGRPGYALFEATKRFLQAQGIFGASTLVLFIAAPINAVL
jgi:multidrug resistance protein, MATE family